MREIFLSVAEYSPAWLYGAALASLRALGMLVLIPLSGVPAIAQLRLAMAIGLGVLIAPSAPLLATFSGAAAVMEFVLGLCIAAPVALALSAVSMWSELGEGMRGQTLGAILDPLSEQQEPSMSVLMRLLAWVTLLGAGVGGQLVSTLYRSTAVLPVGSLGLPQLAATSVYIARATLECLEFLSMLALPLAFAALLVELGLGWIGKAQPQIALTHESFVIKSALLVCLLITSWYSGINESVVILSTPRVPAVAVSKPAEGPSSLQRLQGGYGRR